MSNSQNSGGSTSYGQQTQGVSQQYAYPQSSGQQQVFYQPSYQQSNRGRGRGRFPRDPCVFCGKTNHSPQYCYYRGQTPTYGQIGNGQSGIPLVNQWNTQVSAPNP